MSLGIYLPTYKRADRLQAVANNVESTTRADFTLYFGCEPDDTASIEAAKATGHQVVINKGRSGYSDTIQTIYETSEEPVFFHANDDFEFLDGWDVAPLTFLAENPDVQVLGAHDGMPSVSYSTISFARRKYIEQLSGVVDMPNRVFFPYSHNYVDTEFTYTAQARGVWDKIETPCIKHHRIGGDETYQKNDATSSEDKITFESRRHLWESINKEDTTMTRKPMSEEQKKALSEKARARHAAKIEQKKTSTTGDSRPDVQETTLVSQLDRAIEHIQAAHETLSRARNIDLNMIEASQAVDALQEAAARAGQVRGIVEQKTNG